MTPQELKNSILQLAVQGKLVEQRAEEGTAEELYKKIQAEKQKLTAEKKIKKEKPLPEITAEEIPFDIPESWKWVRLGEIINIVSAKRVHQSDWKNNGIPFYRAREIAKLSVDGFVDNELFISEELYNKFSKYGVPKAGDLMVTAVGTLGKSYIVKEDDKFYYKDASVICLENYGNMVSLYINYVLQSEMMLKQIKSNSSGTTVATLTMIRMVQYMFPLPPLEEQKRIVAKIEALLPQIDRYEKAWNKLEEFNKRFPEDMQKSILQYAVQGKLVEQRAEEGTAEELYKKIQAEKQKLIAEKKIKKEKPLPEITAEEIPFEIPESWKWVRLGEVVINRDSERVPLSVSERNKLKKIYDYYGASGIIDKVDNYLFDKTLLLIGEDGANLLTRRTPIAFLAHGKYWVNNHAHVLDSIDGTLLLDYLMYFVNSISLVKYVTGTAQPKMNQEKMNSIPVALPPLEEQKRIVAKIEELLPLCERLKK